MREKIDPIIDKLLAHTETNFYESNTHLPPLNSIQECVDLCISYCQHIWHFYLDTHYDYHNLTTYTANELYSFLNALRIHKEYSDAHKEIVDILTDEECFSKETKNLRKDY